jgi:uncharacterized delta-60 repeat protein
MTARTATRVVLALLAAACQPVDEDTGDGGATGGSPAAGGSDAAPGGSGGGGGGAGAGGGPVGGTSPDAAVSTSDGSVAVPDGSVAVPDGSVATPDGSVPVADGSVAPPDGSVPEKDGSVAPPDGFVPEPDAFVPEPDAAPPEPDAAPPEPDAAPPCADGDLDGRCDVDDPCPSVADVDGLCPGTPDPGFGENGLARLPAGEDAELLDADVDAQGRIVAVGRIRRGDAGDLLVVRFTRDGGLDPAFGVGGRVEVNLGGTERGHAVRLDGATGHIWVAGVAQSALTGAPAVWALDDDGVIVPAPGGAVAQVFADRPDGAFWRVETAGDGGVWLAGDAVDPGGRRRAFVTRLDAAGGRAGDFAAGADAAPVWAPGDVRTRGLAVLVDGTVVIGGDVQQGAADAWYATRYDACGASLFDTRTDARPPAEAAADHLQTLAASGEGFVAAGVRRAPGGQQTAIVQRFGPDGVADGTFGNGGETILPLAGAEDAAGAVLLAAGERIGDRDRVVVLRLTVAGRPDVSFGNAGRLSLDVPGAGGDVRATALRFAPGRRAIVVGTERAPAGDAPFIVRFVW